MTIACRPKLRGGETAAAILEAHVQRIHDIVTCATEAINLIVLEDIEANVPLNKMIDLSSSGLLGSMFSAVTDSRGSDPVMNPMNHALLQVNLQDISWH